MNVLDAVARTSDEMRDFIIKDLSQGGKLPTADQLVAAVASARGWGSASDFTTPSPHLHGTLARLPGMDQAEERLLIAKLNNETVTVFGDYDVDGVTSLVQMVDFLRAFGLVNVRAYIPDRIEEDYGLKQVAVDNCLAAHNPSLIFTVDCGSASPDVIRYLKGKGVDVIVLDHHGVPKPDNFPAVAHINPKAYPDRADLRDVAECSAAGLCFLFAEYLAKKYHLPNWRRERALIMAGLGTMVDVMPLDNPINRTLVKLSITLANSNAINALPGLKMLAEHTRVEHFDAHTYGFVIGPHLNAAGRVSTAHTAARLLGARSFDQVKPLVADILKANQERKDLQDEVQREATEMADEILLSNPDLRVLVLGNEAWHPGVVGIVASRIKDLHRRPAFVCGSAGEEIWKGSGRSIPGFDLGEAVHKARAAGVLIDGGGHPMAAGIRLDPGNFNKVVEFFDAAARDYVDPGALPVYEILGASDLLPENEWMDLYGLLEPFGNGNPKPHLFAQNAFLSSGPMILMRSDGLAAWGWKAKFELESGASMWVTWGDVDLPPAVWSAGARYDLVLSLSRSKGKTGGTYENWKVADCRLAASPGA